MKDMQQLKRYNIVDSSSRVPKVLQFGGGNFLKAFVDWMVQRLNETCHYQGSVVLVKPTKGGDYTGLRSQDGLFHVVTSGFAKGQVINEVELVSCVDQIIQPYDHYDQFLQTAHLPELRIIVSNTTESGIIYEAAALSNSVPNSFPGKLCVWLKNRFDHFKGSPDSGCIILPCELIEENGSKLKEMVLLHARDWKFGDEFKQWIEDHHMFCNTLVDRIVPGRPDDQSLRQYQETVGYEDDQMVVGEPYHLWAIEGPAWIDEVFPLSKAGINAVITDDLAPYRLQKVRLLNGGHTSMVPIGLLMGIETVGEFVEDPVMGSFLKNTMHTEIIPSIKSISSEQLTDYMSDVLDRFKNPFVKHKLSSIALNSLSKFVVRILPSIEQYQKSEGKLPERLMLSFAGLIKFYQGTFNGEDLPVKDDPDLVNILQDQWRKKDQGEINLFHLCENILSDKKLWGRNLNEINNLKIHLAGALEIIERGDLEEEIARLA